MGGRGTQAALLLSVLAWGCAFNEPFEIPANSEAQSVLFVVESYGHVTATVLRTEEGGVVAPTSMSLQDGDGLYVYLFSVPPEALDLGEGPVPIVEGGRRFPSPLEAHARYMSDGKLLEVQAATAVLGRIGLPPIDLRRCALQGGCLGDDQSICQLPCRIRGAVARPQPPLHRRLENWSCGAGFEDRLYGCDFSVPSACPSGSVPHLGACLVVSGACPPDGDFPSVDGPAVYVRAGAPMGGDGRRLSPFASIAEAVRSAAVGDTIVIAAGQYAGDVVLRGHDLVGACADETGIAGSVIVTTGSNHIEGVTSLTSVWKGPGASRAAVSWTCAGRSFGRPKPAFCSPDLGGSKKAESSAASPAWRSIARISLRCVVSSFAM